MAQATLDAPLTLDPTQATRIAIVATKVDHVARVAACTINMLNAAGAVVGTRTVRLEGAAAQAWIANQEQALLTRVLAKLGVTGAVT